VGVYVCVCVIVYVFVILLRTLWGFNCGCPCAWLTHTGTHIHTLTYAHTHIHTHTHRYWPEGVLSRMVENTEARLHSFLPNEMAALLYGLSHLAISKHIHQQEEQRLLWMQQVSLAS